MKFTATITATAGADSITVSADGFRTAQAASDWAADTIAHHPGLGSFNLTVTVF